MFGAIEHFSEKEQIALLHKIVSHLRPGGRFIGSTAFLGMDEGKAANYEHQREFHSTAELADFLGKFFDEVFLWKSAWSENRIEIYFLCH